MIEIKRQSLKYFAEKNRFIGCFRTISKDGINETIEFLIRNIVERMESYASKGNYVFTTDRKSVVLIKRNILLVLLRRKKMDVVINYYFKMVLMIFIFFIWRFFMGFLLLFL